MARLPAIKTLQIEDFPSQKSWIGKMLVPLNQFMGSVYNSLNGSLELGVNIRAQVQTIEFIEGTTDLPFRFQSTIGRPRMVLIGEAADVSDTPSALTAAPFAVWSFSNGQVVLDDLIGLNSGQTYRLTFLVF